MSQDPRIGAEPTDFLFDTEELYALADGTAPSSPSPCVMPMTTA